MLWPLRQHVKTTRPCEEHTILQAAPKRPCSPGRHLPGPSWRHYLDTTPTLQTSAAVIKTRFLLTTSADILLQSSWSSKLLIMMANVERHLALGYTRAKEVTHRFFIESVRNLQESAWAVQYHALHGHAHRWVLYRQQRERLQEKNSLAYYAWMWARLQSWKPVQGVKRNARLRLAVQHVGEL